MQQNGATACVLGCGESLRGNTIGATGPRASEREICLWEGLLEGGLTSFFQRLLEVFRGFKQRFWEVYRGPLRDPLRGRFPSQRLSVLSPLFVLPLELSPRDVCSKRSVLIMRFGLSKIFDAFKHPAFWPNILFLLGVVLPTLRRSKDLCVFVLHDLLKTDWNWLKLTKTS